ncbi:MAG: sirohydrochlorin cobaltochelatase, partial [Clostridiaceae bacterium]
MNKAIIVVSYGTSCIDAVEKNIKPIEREVAEKYGDEYKVMSAFTSHKIINRLKKEHNMDILTPEKALEQLLEGGYEDVTIQPLHIIPGKEFDYIKKVGKDFS